ncbi:uncharacterized protein LOC116249136 [Nymphaea colorata]|uniref:uncharacterized protein LOC116249136 n=1 Tax=Nymphaea colorata TaxID=210225 RepID=UPI00129D973F|nr:uncharacterized protein LOC116249136 [Nymphaea colorata]XP_031478152.1 uncharacterized protein LOC116249136 [Nymphaea colorata]XP_031478153.1 uncharacterized protein LOC116249136 [Nymphaea colorata]XP_031478154.1 uncharacterized protein LOC116249136 [Nymphaea colorata]XP_049932417.1 uncharacterized protein LOC116249136 [Nymphaea colorata]
MPSDGVLAASAMQESEVRVRVRVTHATELRHRIRRLLYAGTDFRSLKREPRQIFQQLRHRVAALRPMRKERLHLPPALSCSSSSSSSPSSVASSVGSTNGRRANPHDELQVLNGNLRLSTQWFVRKKRSRDLSSWSFISGPSSCPPSPSSTSSDHHFIPLKRKTRRTSSGTAYSDDAALFGCPSLASVSSERSSWSAFWPRECVASRRGRALRRKAEKLMFVLHTVVGLGDASFAYCSVPVCLSLLMCLIHSLSFVRLLFVCFIGFILRLTLSACLHASIRRFTMDVNFFVCQLTSYLLPFPFLFFVSSVESCSLFSLFSLI